jgi:indolepyruvate decarboxylase
MNQRGLRPVVFVGDGAFQMTGLELSSIAKEGLNPIVFVLNNKGYSTERFIHDGAYNDIHNWNYHAMPALLGTGWGCEAHTEGDLEEALARVIKNKGAFSIINLHLDPYDKSSAMERLGKRLSERL